MHRSVTFSEIFSSTFSDDLNRYGDPYDRNVKAKFIAKIGIGLVEFILSTVFLCYGIVFSECLHLQVCTLENGLWTPILYISAWHIAEPWSKHICNYFENNRYNVFRYSIWTATVLIFIGFLVPGQVLSYGLFAGILSNFITVQLKIIAIERFDMDLKTFEGNIQVARALNLLLMPHFMLLLVTYYDINHVKYIFAAFLLNVIPAMLIVKPLKNKKRLPEVARYGTLPAFSNQIREMMVFSNPANISRTNTPDLSSESDDEEKENVLQTNKDDLTFDINVINDQSIQPVQLTPYNVQTYYSKVGVSILPGIPEEMETDNASDNDSIDTINFRRISKISMRLEEINQFSKKTAEEQQEIQNNQNMNSFPTDTGEILTGSILDSNTILEVREIKDIEEQMEYKNTEGDYFENLDVHSLVSRKRLEEPERIQNIEYIQNYGHNKPRFLKELRSVKSGCCCGCSPYRKFIWKRRYRSFMDFFIDNLFKPLSISCKDLHYYPTVVSKVVMTITSTMCFTLIPHMALEKNKSFEPEDSAFLLSYIAFSWCLFLVLLPLVINFSKGKFRVTFILGLVLIGTCMTLISRRMTNDIMTISCLLLGFGYGITSYTENMVYRSFVGARKWDMIQGTLETTTGILVILTYYIIYRYSLDLSILLLVGLVSYYVLALLWIVLPILKDIIIVISKYCRNHQEQIVM